MSGFIFLTMASIYEVSKIINAIATGIEDECLKCMDENKNIIRDSIQEQLFSGIDGTDRCLTPTYDNDPYFNEPGPWQNKPEKYKRWKEKITPPISSYLLNLPPRPTEVPNLFITGTFYDSIRLKKRNADMQVFTEGFIDGPDILKKYGDKIFSLGSTAREYFIMMHLRPWIERFFRECGYK